MMATLTAPDNLDVLDAAQLRELVTGMSRQMQEMQQLIELLTHEIAVLRRLKFALQSERHLRSPEQQREWAAIWPRLAQRHDTLLMENLYQPLFDLPRENLPVMLQDDGLHASAKGVALIVESLGPKVEALISEAEKARP